ncbi:MAG: hypothetical protein GH155_06200 [Spirochaeta sp.]|nr:hypothetical protein [Spirochaeta sp.]
MKYKKKAKGRLFLLASVMLILTVFTGCAGGKNLIRDRDRFSSFDQYLTQKAEIPCYSSSRPQFYFTGDAITDRLVELIDSARDYILIDSYLAFEDKMGLYIFEKLKEKISRGVRIYVITDSSSFYITDRAGIPCLCRLGIPCAEYNPIRGRRFPLITNFLERDHRKFWIFDGQVVLLGGANINSHSLMPPELNGHFDIMVEFQSKDAVTDLVCSFVATWNIYSLSQLKSEDFMVQQNIPSDCSLWLINQGPGSRLLIRDMIDGLFSFAEEEVWLFQSYTITSPSLIRQIRHLSEKGVKVNIILSRNQVYDKFKKASFYGIKDVLSAGGTVYIFDSPTSLLHAKVFAVDGRWISVGSANLNFRSKYLARELNVMFRDDQVSDLFARQLDQVLANSRKIDETEAMEYRTITDFWKWVLLQLGG